MQRKRTAGILLSAALTAVAMLAGCTQAEQETSERRRSVTTEMALPAATEESTADVAVSGVSGETEEMEAVTLNLEIGGRTLTATLAENSSARALMALLEEGSITIDMQDYAGMEKVGLLGASLPINDEQITTGPGDLILYQGNRFVIYYGTNSWSLTRLGKIEGVTQAELKSVLGDGNVSVTLSLE